MKYVCSKCNANKCKLWRPMSVLACQVDLTCWECLEKLGYEIKINDERPDDQVYDREIGHTCYGPAVPDLDGSWWGYTSVPHWWVEWWKGLPDKRSDCDFCRGSGKIGSKIECFECNGTGLRKIASVN